ncbi:MAG: PilZ domain-containing protein [Myxococcales bacterium]|jgi:hypothetical protein
MELHDYRRAERVPVQLVVKAVLGGQPYRADLINLSLTGGFLELDSQLPPGTRMDLHLPLPGGEPLIVRATVSRYGTCTKHVNHREVDNLVVAAEGVGLVFDELEDADAQRLQDYLDLVIDRF